MIAEPSSLVLQTSRSFVQCCATHAAVATTAMVPLPLLPLSSLSSLSWWSLLLASPSFTARDARRINRDQNGRIEIHGKLLVLLVLLDRKSSHFIISDFIIIVSVRGHCWGCVCLCFSFGVSSFMRVRASVSATPATTRDIC